MMTILWSIIGLLVLVAGVLGVLLSRARVESAALNVRLEESQRSAAEKIDYIQQSEVRLKTDFENLANRIFEEKGKALNEQNREKIADILQPLRSQLSDFRKRVDEVHESETRESARLFAQIKVLQEASNKVSLDANNLAAAIKGDSKAQGDWGELIVSRIFEASGLRVGQEYEEQKGFNGPDGDLKKPDFIVHLPEKKVVIVDSKVSLTAYARFNAADDDVARKAAMAEHVKSVRNHMLGLQEKNYTQLLGNRTLDFVIMCIPLEPAFQAAMQADENLLYDVARSRVVICGPATLMMTLKLIAQIWRRENENRNAELIADKAGKMYDQIALVYEAMADAQKKMNGVQESFELAMKRLRTGKGSLSGRAEDLRVLGAKVTKVLPSGALESESAAE